MRLCVWGCMQHGEVVETGRHADLVDRGGTYAQMWARQVEASQKDAHPASAMEPADVAEAKGEPAAVSGSVPRSAQEDA